MAWLLVLLLVIVVPILLWAVIAPRSQWWALTSWRFRDPHANEPSDTAYAYTRVVCVLALVGLLGLGYWLWSEDRERDLRAEAESEFRSTWSAAPSDVSVVGDIEQEDASAEIRTSSGAVLDETVTLGAYDAVDDDTAYVADLPDSALDAVPSGTDLLVSVPLNPFQKPTHVRVEEDDMSVTVTVYGVCTAPSWDGSGRGCDASTNDGVAGSPMLYLVPVDLAEPLGDRRVVDGSVDDTVPAAG